MKSQVKYIVMADTETGGLPNSNVKAFDDIALCEVALVVIDVPNLKICDEFSAIIKPYKEGLIYSAEAEEVHKITKQVIDEQGIELKDAFKIVKQYLTKYKNPYHKAIFGGHNFAGYDMSFFENMFSFFEDDIYNYVKWVEDTQKLAYYAFPELPNYKLTTCCNAVGVELVEAHRALQDTKSNALLMIELLKWIQGGRTTNREGVMDKDLEYFRKDFEL